MDPGRRAVFGLRAHSGWAVLVTVAGPGTAPTVVNRRRIELADQPPAQPYHRAAKLQDLAAAAAVIQEVRDDANVRACAAMTTAVADARTSGYDVRRAALLVSEARVLPPLDAILASHPLLHAAEGELFRQAVTTGCEHCTLRVTQLSERSLYEDGSRVLELPPATLRTRLAAFGQSLGPPWTADHKNAALAAWLMLVK